MGTHTQHRVLVTGALGQIGSELTLWLKERYGADNVIATDIQPDAKKKLSKDVAFETLDVLKPERISSAVRKHRIDAIYHLAALLSAVAEKKPRDAWDINMGGLINVLDAAKENRCSVFFPSSIGAFGPSTPQDGTPQDTIQRPTSMYGVTKVAGELLCDYYAAQSGVDVRGVRFPGRLVRILVHATHRRIPPGFMQRRKSRPAPSANRRRQNSRQSAQMGSGSQ